MEYNDNTEYAKGGRISPEQSATIPPLGTLSVGNNGDVWITEADKNGRKSWKPTPITKAFLPLINYGYNDDESFDFEIDEPNFKWLLRYCYDIDSYTLISIETADGKLPTKDLEYADLDSCRQFFIDNFDQNQFNLYNKNKSITSDDILSNVNLLFKNIKYLIKEKGLREPTPQKYKIGDFVVSPSGIYTKVVGFLGNTQIKTNKANGKDERDFYYYFPDDVSLIDPQPKFKIGDKVVFLGNSKIMIVNDIVFNDYNNKYEYETTWEESGEANSVLEEFLELYNEPTETPNPKFKVGDIVKFKGVKSKLEVKSNKWNGEEWICEVIDVNTKNSNKYSEVRLELFKEPKFKVGDKVNLPTTKAGQPINSNLSEVWAEAKLMGQDYLIVTEVWDNQKIVLNNTIAKGGDDFREDLDNIKLYEETPEIDDMIGKLFLKENDKKYYIKTEKEPYLVPNSKEYEYIEPILANEDKFVLNTTPNAEKIDVYFTLELSYKKGIAIWYKSRNLTEGSGYITDKEIFRNTMNLIISDLRQLLKKDFANKLLSLSISFVDLIWKAKDIKCEFVKENPTKKDCETDASLIVSGQVKKFYDLNKTRIEKLNPTFSCKIIKALLSLSEYEKCGKPSKVKLPQPKDDLLSEIKNLKF